MYETDREWQHYAIIKLIGVKRAIYELILAISLLALGFAAAAALEDVFTKYVPLFVALGVGISAFFAMIDQRDAQRDLERLVERWMKEQGDPTGPAQTGAS
jgi:hypothetical protein